MTIVNNGGTINKVSGLSIEEEQRAKDFLQGLVYCWCKNKSGKKFAARDLVGAENTDWNGTPLQRLYYKHTKAGASEDEAYGKAAIDVGWLLKRVIEDDRRKFKLIDGPMVNHYQWDGELGEGED
ncbi:hypothetical protein [Candidatus Spongiihabitans sp.]|uniref:hypothetical protein n=1 Tax=Candidatus Spongiihabitans sp. TaxID=3101308 RepID=UPI003C7DE13E